MQTEYPATGTIMPTQMQFVLRWFSMLPLFPVILILLAMLVSAAPASARDDYYRTEVAATGQVDWLARAAELERSKDWQGLLDWGRRWAGTEPGNATAWFVQGQAFSKMHRYPDAIEAYRQNLNLEPGDVYALNNLGNVYRDSRLFREAITAYRDAVQIDPGYTTAWQNLGLTFYALKGLAGVTLALQKLNASDRDLADAWRKLIIEYSLSRDPRVAKKAIDVLRGLDGDKRRRMFEIVFAGV
jgi:tetratricopeptide (TPR) repeat protein